MTVSRASSSRVRISLYRSGKVAQNTVQPGWLGFLELEGNTLSSVTALKSALCQQKVSALLSHDHLHTQMCSQYPEHTHTVHANRVHTAHRLCGRKHRGREGRERQERWRIRKTLSSRQCPQCRRLVMEDPNAESLRRSWTHSRASALDILQRSHGRGFGSVSPASHSADQNRFKAALQW